MDFLLSKARRAILARTHLSPEREFYLRELVRETGLAPRTVQLELDRLVTAGLLTERRHGNRRYLRAANGHPLFAPLREIVLKTTGLVPVLREALGTDGVSLALVFGSMATGATGADSDIDLLVVGDVGLRQVSSRLRGSHERLGREINPVVWTVKEFRERIDRKDPFLTRVLANPRLMVVGDERDVAGLGGQPLAAPAGSKRRRGRRHTAGG